MELPLTEKEKIVGTVALGEEQEFGSGQVMFEIPIRYPSGGVGLKVRYVSL